MSGELELDFEWLDADWGDEAERATYASLRMEADGMLATEVVDAHAKSVRSRIHVSTHRLASWFVANWWRLRWEPKDPSPSIAWRLSHNLASAGGGYVWPDLLFASDGETVLVEAKPSSTSSPEVIRYLNEFEVSVSAEEFERGVTDFIDGVLARLTGVGADGDELRSAWKVLQAERQERTASRWRRLEALLGFDPGQAPEALIEELFGLAEEVGERAMEEVASESKSDAATDLRDLWRQRGRAVPLMIEGLEGARDEDTGAPDASAPRPPWYRGEKLAKMARESWGVGRGPLDDAALADLAGVPRSFLSGDQASEASMSAGFRDDGDGHLSALIDKRHPNSRRFALVRLLGDYLTADPSDRLLPATNTKTARQKLQRAFAHEFLCPFDELMEFFGAGLRNEEEIDDAAAHFHVSPLLIATKLVNKHVLDRGVLSEWEI